MSNTPRGSMVATMMLNRTLKCTMLEPGGDAVVVEDEVTGVRWVIGMEDVPAVIRLVDDALHERAGAIQTNVGGARLTVPVDAYVMFAMCLGYFMGVTTQFTGVKPVSIPEFARLTGFPVHMVRNGRSA